MRATDLNFRSPKEKTAEFNHPLVTFDGRSLPIVHSSRHSTFSKARRFSQYDYQARKTGERAGPGAYDLTHRPGNQWKIKGSPVYKSLHHSIDTSNNGFYFYGNSIVYEPSFVLKHKGSERHRSGSSTNKDLTLRSGSLKQTNPTTGTENKDNTGRSESKEIEKSAESNPRRISTGVPKNRLFKRSERFINSPYLESQSRGTIEDLKKK